ncbi:MAG TPA: NADH-quinone oxidoreductase subunit N [Thermoplasmata archaeon]|nr:NADH-quinone oxidoreductase subunit N [Thermoplasmata archaeon]
MANYLVFLPETILVVVGFASIVLGFAWGKKPAYLWALALAGTLAALVITLDMMGLGLTTLLGLQLWPSPIGTQGDFTSDLKLKVDAFALLFHLVFLLIAFLAILASRGFIHADEPHQGEYYGLMLLAVVGMMFTAAAMDLFVLFLAFETSSMSTFALVAFRKKDKESTEAAVKFFIIGAISSAIILFGISLVYGVAGSTAIGPTLDLTKLQYGLNVAVIPGMEPPLIVALVLLVAGFGFKAAVVPFHMWAPDVYQGSPTTISTFLAAGSKMVGVVALIKVFLTGLLSVQVDWVVAISVLAIATMTLGNVLAIPQRSVKRMLAYSSIAQVGYILIALPVGAVAINARTGNPTVSLATIAAATTVATAALLGALFHVFTYAAMKGGAFLVVAGTQSRGIADDMDAYRGLSRRMPFMALAMTIFLLSLAGIPPLGGFFSKFFLFSSAVSAMTFSPWYVVLAIAGVLNSALSVYYYARVIWYMYILEPEGDVAKMTAPRSISAGVLVALAIVLLTGVLAFWIYNYLFIAAQSFFGFM